MRTYLASFMLASTLLSSIAAAQSPPNPPGRAALPDETAGLNTLDPRDQRALKNAIPLTPAMIEELQQRYGDVQRAQEQASQVSASPISRVISAAFAPGQATNIIQTVRGYPTAISFFDATGQPWPVAWSSNSNAANGGSKDCNSSPQGLAGGGRTANETTGFYVCVPVSGSNTIEITPMSIVPRGGLVVSLLNAPKPLSFLLLAGHDRYDADLSIHVSDRGPNAKENIDTRIGAPITGAPYMNAMLAGVAPADAKPLSVTGVSPDEIRAWRIGGEIYLRTRYTLMSPPWDSTESGEGGTSIYAIPNTPVVLLSANGRTVSAELKEDN